jgi:hypothetical protein
MPSVPQALGVVVLPPHQTPLLAVHEGVLSCVPRPPAGAGGRNGGHQSRGAGHTRTAPLGSLNPDTVITTDPPILVGTGTPKDEWCGRVLRCVAKCPDCGDELVLRGSSCGRAECPRCWSGWASRLADKASLRVFGYRRAARFSFFSRHVIISPPPALLKPTGDPRELQGMWRACMMVGRASGLIGGAAIMHWYRIADDGPRGKDRYKEIRESGRWRDLVTWSPHLHTLAYGKVDHNAVPPGWVVRVLGRLGSRDKVGHRMYYALDHASPGPGHVLRYFGDCGYNKLLEDHVYRSHVPLKCLKCGADMVVAGETGSSFPVSILVARWFGTFKIK